ncbi:MAG: DnaA N-terminal domain-containing protein, partial [bacterium]
MIAMNRKNQETEMPKPLVERADHKETCFSDDGAGEWQRISNSLRKSIGSDAFQRWFGVATWHSASNGEGIVTVPGEIHQVWIETNYLPELMMAASEECEG